MLAVESGEVNCVGLTPQRTSLIVDRESQIVGAPERSPRNLNRRRYGAFWNRHAYVCGCARLHCSRKLERRVAQKLDLITVDCATPSANAACRVSCLEHGCVNIQ